jgi:hypothetical protein
MTAPHSPDKEPRLADEEPTQLGSVEEPIIQPNLTRMVLFSQVEARMTDEEKEDESFFTRLEQEIDMAVPDVERLAVPGEDYNIRCLVFGKMYSLYMRSSSVHLPG